ncbi:MAG TPA: hypothetical protein VN039_15545 [Nitrospira sp.]|nr:hypothetical protein [Nitrospira sp.]
MVYGPVAANIAATNTGTTEAVIATTPTISSAPAGGAGYSVRGVVTFTGNASASTCTLKVRQGSNTTSGTAVYTSPAITVAAGAVVSIPFACLDLTAAGTGVANYSVTQTNSGGAGNSGTIVGYVEVMPAVEND